MSTGDVKQALQEFDGNAISILSEIRAQKGSEKGFLANLVKLSADAEENISTGASWILKAEMEEGARLTPA